MKVLVTGGTGFIGSNLVVALIRHGYSVRVLRRAQSDLIALNGLPVEYAIGELLDPRSVRQAVEGCDWVFHVASLSSYWRSTRQQVYRVNIEGTRTIIQACLDARVKRVVYTSSAAAIGIPPSGTLGTEETIFDARSARFAYADSKHLAEGQIQDAVARGLDAVIVNPATVIGARDHYMISGSIIIEFLRGRLIAVPPGGMCVADVDAVVEGHLAAIERGRVGERYILGGENLSHRQIAAIVAQVVQRPPPRLTAPVWLLGPIATLVDGFNAVSRLPPIVNGDQIRLGGFNFFFDSTKAVRELDYPLLPFRGAVEKAYHWYRTHGYLN